MAADGRPEQLFCSMAKTLLGGDGFPGLGDAGSACANLAHVLAGSAGRLFMRINTDQRVVIALGGNALGDTPEEQMARLRTITPSLVEMISHGNEIIITHGNGPQIGMIQDTFSYASEAGMAPAMGAA
jgi:hypothetical protein